MVRGFSRFVLFLFLGLLRAPTRNSPERVRDTIWTFPEKSGNTRVWKPPGLASLKLGSGAISAGKACDFEVVIANRWRFVIAIACVTKTIPQKQSVCVVKPTKKITQEVSPRLLWRELLWRFAAALLVTFYLRVAEVLLKFQWSSFPGSKGMSREKWFPPPSPYVWPHRAFLGGECLYIFEPCQPKPPCSKVFFKGRPLNLGGESVPLKFRGFGLTGKPTAAEVDPSLL